MSVVWVLRVLTVSDIYQQNRTIQRKCLRASRSPMLDLSLTLNRTMSLPVHSRIRSFQWHSKQLQVKPFHSRTWVCKLERNTKTQILHPRRYLYYIYITMSNCHVPYFLEPSAEFVEIEYVMKLLNLRVPGLAVDICKHVTKEIRTIEWPVLEIWPAQVTALILCLFLLW